MKINLKKHLREHDLCAEKGCIPKHEPGSLFCRECSRAILRKLAVMTGLAPNQGKGELV